MARYSWGAPRGAVLLGANAVASAVPDQAATAVDSGTLGGTAATSAQARTSAHLACVGRTSIGASGIKGHGQVIGDLSGHASR